MVGRKLTTLPVCHREEVSGGSLGRTRNAVAPNVASTESR